MIINGGNIMGYWDESPDPRHLPISEREAWHRDAWLREQDELLELSNEMAGHDAATGFCDDFGFCERGTAL